MRTPMPPNFHAMSDAWNSPIAFAAELAKYYADLEADGYRVPTPDITKRQRTIGH